MTQFSARASFISLRYIALDTRGWR